MKPTTTILLLIIAAALGAYVFFIERNQPGTLQLTTEPPLAFPVEKARSITMNRGGETVALARSEDDRWFLLEPLQDRADQQVCADILETLSTLTIRETIGTHEIESGVATLADLGLGEDRGTHLAIAGPDGPLGSIIIGNQGALDGTTYARFPGDPHHPDIYVVDTDLTAFAARTITNLRDPDVLPFAPDRVGRILVRNGETSVEAYYDPDRRLWKLGKPLQSRADQKAVEDLIARVCALEIVGFEENSEQIASTITNRQSISVWTINQEDGTVPATDEEPSIVLEIAPSPDQPVTAPDPEPAAVPPPAPVPAPGGENAATGTAVADNPAPDAEEKIYALGKVSDREAVLRVPDEVVKILATSPNTLRDAHLAQIPDKEIQGIIIQTPDNPDVILTNNGRRWVSLRNGDWESAHGGAIARLLRALNREKVIDFVADTSANLADFNLAPPAIRIGLTTSRKVMVPGVQQPEPDIGNEAPSTSTSNLKDPDALNYVLGLGHIPATPENDVERLYATFADEPFVVSINPAFLDAVPLHPLAWKDPAIFGFNIVSLREIRILPADETTARRLTYDPFSGAWELWHGEEQVTDKLDPQKAHTLAERLGSLTASDWLTNREAAYRALENPTLTIAVTLSFLSEDGDEDLEKRTTLTFGPVAGSAPANPSHFHYARIDDSPEVFLIENESLQSLLPPVTK